MAALHSFVGLAALLVALPSMAQSVYKCGSTYSQTPCDTKAKPTAITNNAAPAQADGLAGRELCAAGVAQHLGFRDPEKAGIAAVSKAPAEVIQYAGAPLVAHKFIVNAKGKLYGCYLSEDERRLLVIGEPPVSDAEARLAEARARWRQAKADNDKATMDGTQRIVEDLQRSIDANQRLSNELRRQVQQRR